MGALPSRVAASNGAFACITDGSVDTWGDAHDGGDSRAVQGMLTDVLDIQDLPRFCGDHK